MIKNPDYLEKMPEGMRELKRIFGAENVSEEIYTPPSYLQNEPETWCYVIDIDRNHPLFSYPPKSDFDFDRGVVHMETVLGNALTLLYCMENKKFDVNAILAKQELDPRRLVIPVEFAEEADSIAALKKTSHEQMALQTITEDIDSYKSWLRRTSRGIRWEYVTDQEGCYFQTVTTLNRNPRELEIGISSLLGAKDDALMESRETKARIPLRILVDYGYEQELPNTVLPKPQGYVTHK